MTRWGLGRMVLRRQRSRWTARDRSRICQMSGLKAKGSGGSLQPTLGGMPGADHIIATGRFMKACPSGIGVQTCGLRECDLQAEWEVGDTADLEVCATVVAVRRTRGFTLMCDGHVQWVKGGKH